MSANWDIIDSHLAGAENTDQALAPTTYLNRRYVMSTDKKASRFRQPVNILSVFLRRRIRFFIVWLYVIDAINVDTYERWRRRAGR